MSNAMHPGWGVAGMRPLMAAMVAGLVLTAVAGCSRLEREPQNPTSNTVLATPAQDAGPVAQPAATTVAPPPPPPQGLPMHKAASPAPVAEARSRADVAREAVARAPVAVAPQAVPSPMPAGVVPPGGHERYQPITDNPVQVAAQSPVSTFSVDVDTGSYSNVRRMLNQGQLPPADAVRVEEMINYFPYDYAQPTDGRPLAVRTELTTAPWDARKQLLSVSVKGKDVAKQSLPPVNLVFLVDVSGSMNTADKLPLLKASLKLLVQQLRAQDRISLVTYASGTRIALPPTPGHQKTVIAAAIDALAAGGSTAGASGIALAYSAAQQAYMPQGINRILLATDGDFNVGVSDPRTLKSLVEEKRKSGISLSTLGFGTGNYHDALMEQLADAGDGAYSYIDNLMEGHKVLVNEMTSTLATIAQDVKVQIEFNPAVVQEYRLIGYENRVLQREDFHNDKVDAGDVGAGHTVTALYEVTPVGTAGLVDRLRYGAEADKAAPVTGAKEMAHVKLRYKLPGQSHSVLMEQPVPTAERRPLAQASNELRFAAAVAGFGQLLRGGKYTGADWGYADVRALAAGSVGPDRFGYRAEFLRLVDLAQAQSTQRPVAAALRHP